MSGNLTATNFGIGLAIFSFIAFSAYCRIQVYLRHIDSGLENPPGNRNLGEKLRTYRDFCHDRDRKPILLYIFSLAILGAFICWLPLPIMLFF